jgi:NAD(P)-dependent dehydrogenase (short-subunit alcohol dehydrogenase family)
MPARLQGRTALVTGSTDGIGAGIARTLAAEGAHVIVTGRDEIRGAKVADGITGSGGAATFVRADLSDEASNVHGATLSVDGGRSAI